MTHDCDLPITARDGCTSVPGYLCEVKRLG